MTKHMFTMDFKKAMLGSSWIIHSGYEAIPHSVTNCAISEGGKRNL